MWGWVCQNHQRHSLVILLCRRKEFPQWRLFFPIRITKIGDKLAGTINALAPPPLDFCQFGTSRCTNFAMDWHCPISMLCFDQGRKACIWENMDIISRMGRAKVARNQGFFASLGRMSVVETSFHWKAAFRLLNRCAIGLRWFVQPQKRYFAGSLVVQSPDQEPLTRLTRSRSGWSASNATLQNLAGSARSLLPDQLRLPQKFSDQAEMPNREKSQEVLYMNLEQAISEGFWTLFWISPFWYRSSKRSQPMSMPIWLDDEGTGQWKWMEEVPRRTSLVPLASFACTLFNRGGNRKPSSLPRPGDHLHCAVNLRPVIFGVDNADPPPRSSFSLRFGVPIAPPRTCFPIAAPIRASKACADPGYN